MIEDITFESINCIFEFPQGESGGNLITFSMDGDNYEIKSLEISTVFIN